MRAPATHRKNELLDAAAMVFESAGIRASISDVAAACGLLTGSLYHHFDSKESIVVELVERYVRDLEDLADAAAADVGHDGLSGVRAIERLSVAIADLAVRHRAALLLTFHEPPTSYAPDLAQLARRVPVAITATMRTLLDRAHASGYLHDDVDRRVLAERLCQNMLHVAVGVFHRKHEARDVPLIRCRMLLHGIAAHWPVDEDLDASVARRAADEVINSWPAREEPEADRDARVLTAARSEFARRGYEATTVRDVAQTAGVSTKAVYRIVRSKEELLWRILAPYAEQLIGAWDAVLTSNASPLEKLDALLWLNINVLDRYNEENSIISVFMQHAPPSSDDLDPGATAGPSDIEVPFAGQLDKVGSLLAAGLARGQLRLPPATPDIVARCVFALLWTPHDIIQRVDRGPTLDFNRATLLRGAVLPSSLE